MTRLAAVRASRRTGQLIAVGLAVGVLATGCTSGVGGGQASSSAAGTTSATSTSPSTTTSSSTSPSASSAATASSTTTSSVPEPTTGTVDLSDFFNVGTNWEQRRYDVADRSDVQGIGTEVGDCYAASAEVIEIRLSNRFQRLEFSAAQANDSLRSDQELSVQILGNNEQLDIRSVPFNQVQPFSIDVRGVNALQIRLSLDPTVPTCRGNVIGVLLEPVLS